MEHYKQRVGLLATGLTVFFFSLVMSGSEMMAAPKNFMEWRTLVGFCAVSIAIVASCTLMRGVNNIRTSALFAGAVLIDNLIYEYWWHFMSEFGLYVVVWAAVISRIPFYFLLRYNFVWSFKSLCALHKLEPLKAWCEDRADEMEPTRFSIEVRVIPKALIACEFTYVVVTIIYALLMQIPPDGSVYETIQINNHFDFYYVSVIADDLVRILMIYILISGVLRDSKEPDAL